MLHNNDLQFEKGSEEENVFSGQENLPKEIIGSQELTDAIRGQISINSNLINLREVRKTITQLFIPQDPHVQFGTCSINPGIVTPSASATFACSIPVNTGAADYPVWMTPPSAMETGLIYQGASVAGSTEITVRLFNATTLDIDGAARTWNWMIIPTFSISKAGTIIRSWQFPDASSAAVAAITFTVPLDYQLISLKLVWTTPASSGNLAWDALFDEGGEGEAIGTRGFTTATQTVVAPSSASVYKFTEILNDTTLVQRIRMNNVWGMRWRRLGADAADTLSNTMNLYGFLATFN